MKKIIFGMMLSCLIAGGVDRARAADEKNNPSQFPLAAHISASAYAPENDSKFGAFDPLHEIVT